MKENIIERAQRGEFTLIAEIGVNYYDIAVKCRITPLEAAKKMIAEAAEAGVHAVKFQSYKAETLAAKESPSYWDTSEEPTTSQFELFQKYDSFGQEEYDELKRFSDECGTEFLSTAFDIESADYLEPLMNVYKISSSDLTNLPFIKYQAKKNKPVLLSVGASTKDEIEAAVRTIRSVNKQPLVLLHCVLEYPTPYEHANLKRIQALKLAYPDCVIGYSDHTKAEYCAEVSGTAYLFGACIMEKHFTLDKTLRGNDHYHAMDPCDVRKILKAVEFQQKISGDGDINASDAETAARQNARRSLVAKQSIPKGTVITESMLTWKRPASGISPSNLNKVVGKRAAVAIEEDSILQRTMLEEENVQ